MKIFFQTKKIPQKILWTPSMQISPPCQKDFTPVSKTLVKQWFFWEFIFSKMSFQTRKMQFRRAYRNFSSPNWNFFAPFQKFVRKFVFFFRKNCSENVFWTRRMHFRQQFPKKFRQESKFLLAECLTIVMIRQRFRTENPQYVPLSMSIAVLTTVPKFFPEDSLKVQKSYEYNFSKQVVFLKNCLDS